MRIEFDFWFLVNLSVYIFFQIELCLVEDEIHLVGLGIVKMRSCTVTPV